MSNADSSLRELVAAILADDSAAAGELMAASPQLATASFEFGATRQSAEKFFIAAIGRYINAGDTALHLAAAAYRTEIARKLIAAGANPRARNRHGDEPLHAAACGSPGSRAWNPEGQAAMIVCLVEAGADPNAKNKIGAAPLHKAVRTRCAMAVRTLLTCGANPNQPNGSGSSPMLLATQNTGRGGSGSLEAKAQQREIVLMLETALKGT
jgi:ankyrin repeat protein